MLTAEELENFDIFPKEYSFSCLFKFIFYSLSTILSFLLLYSFYTDRDIYSVLTMNYNNRYEDLIINDYLTNKLIELSPKDFLSENKTTFTQTYENLENIFFKEYIMNSYPCLIKNSSEYFGGKEAIDLIEENLILHKDKRIIFEYRENPYTQFFDDDYQYLKISYDTFINATKNISQNYYFLNEFNLFNLENVTDKISEKYLKNNYLVNNLELKHIYFSRAESFVVVGGHMETFDNFICIQQGNIEFILLPPQEKKNIYPYSRNGPINYSRVNFFEGKNNNSEDFPNFFKANKVYINLSAGECLYIPAFWWKSYRTNKRKKNKTIFLTFKFSSNSQHLEKIMYIRNKF